MWFLDADEATGVDRDLCHVPNYAGMLKRCAFESGQALRHGCVAHEDRDWWEACVPEFLKEGRFPQFVKRDMTRPTVCDTDLPDDHFDLAFCSNVLYRVHSEHGMDGVTLAIEEMRRAAKPGGWVAASEPDDDSLSFLGAFFDHAVSDDGKILYTRHEP